MEQPHIDLEFNSIVTRICEKNNITDSEKAQLISLLGNSEMYNERAMNHPTATVQFMVRMGAEKILEESIPQVGKWEKEGEKVSLFRVLLFLLVKYLEDDKSQI